MTEARYSTGGDNASLLSARPSGGGVRISLTVQGDVTVLHVPVADFHQWHADLYRVMEAAAAFGDATPPENELVLTEDMEVSSGTEEHSASAVWPAPTANPPEKEARDVLADKKPPKDAPPEV